MVLLTASMSPQLIDFVGAVTCFFRIAGSSALKSKSGIAANHSGMSSLGIGVTRFMDGGRIEIDPQRRQAKDALSAGSDAGPKYQATIPSLIATALCRARHKAVMMTLVRS